MKRIVISSVLALSLLSGCDNDPAKGKTEAVVSEPVEPAKAAPAQPAAPPPTSSTTFVIAPAGSSLEFTGAKITAKHDVKLKDFSGSINLVDGDPTKSSVKVEIKMATLETEPAKFQKHLTSPDLLDVEKFPTAEFESTSIKAGGEGGATHTVTGNLTLHGQKKSITFPANITTSADSVGVKAEFAIDRKDFGVTYPGMPDDLIQDKVLIRLNIDAKKG